MSMRAFALWLCLVALPATAATEIMPNAADEARAHALGAQLRCVVCQSETINDSQADMARDMRLLVRDKISAGWGDKQIIQYMRERYGDYVLMKPPLRAGTLVLWGLPFALAGAVLFIGYRQFSGQKYRFSRRK